MTTQLAASDWVAAILRQIPAGAAPRVVPTLRKLRDDLVSLEKTGWSCLLDPPKLGQRADLAPLDKALEGFPMCHRTLRHLRRIALWR